MHDSHLWQRSGLFYLKKFAWFLTIVPGVLPHFEHFLKNIFEKSDQPCDRDTIKGASCTMLGDHMIFPMRVPYITEWNPREPLSTCTIWGHCNCRIQRYFSSVQYQSCSWCSMIQFSTLWCELLLCISHDTCWPCNLTAFSVLFL